MPWLRSTLMLLLLTSMVQAEDWPQWLGPRRDASTTEKIPPWKGQLKVLWKKDVGEGNSSPLVADGKVYLHDKDRQKFAEQLQVFDAEKGEPLWQSSYLRSNATFLFGNGPRATPAIDGDRVYTFGITGILTCFDLKMKKQHWQVDTVKELNAPKLFFGSSCSPLIEGDAVLINVGAKGASIVAFDKATGKILWKKLDDPASYASPMAFGEGEKRQAVFFTGDGVVSLSPKDGEIFWQFPFKDEISESSSTPVKVGNLMLASSITRGTVALRPDPQNFTPKERQVWYEKKLTCYFSTPVAVGEQVYLVTGTPPKKPLSLFGEAVLRCIEAKSGKELWKGPKVGTFHASLIRTGDNKLLLLEESGNLALLEPNAKGYQELARSKICGSTWSHAAISNGKLYVRDANELVCVELPSSK